MAAASPDTSTGLYDSRHEHDACGVGFVADLAGRRSHGLVCQALTVLRNLDHRGARGSDPDTGDGAGIITQLPDELFRAACPFTLPGPGEYAAGMAFLPVVGAERRAAVEAIGRLARLEGLTVLGWRDVPHDPPHCGPVARSAMPWLSQLFVARAGRSRPDSRRVPGNQDRADLHRADPHRAELDRAELDRRAFCLRRRAEHEAGIYLASLSAATIVYKGMLTAPQLGQFYPDLTDAAFASALALVHSRFSTNTHPSWPLAHPYRLSAHNGEINTIRGNRNWMRAREASLASSLIPADAAGRGIERLLPVLDESASDSASFDACLELLHMGGRSLPHAVLMMIPEPWQGHPEMDPARRDFYRYHASLLEPWDGPALIGFTDGTIIGAVLDRNGLRPGRYWVTDSGLVVLASEVGVLDVDPPTIVRKGRLQPGRIFLADTAAGRIVEDEEVKAALAAEHPYGEWLHAGLVHLDDLPDRPRELPAAAPLATRQRLFGYTEEELRVILGPMASTGAEPVGSMGTDTPIAALSRRPRQLFDYFSQQFAQVTNPPLDAIREELVTSLGSTTGPEHNLLDPGPASCRQLELPYPVIGDGDLARIVGINHDGDKGGLRVHVVDGRFPASGGGDALRARLAQITEEVSDAIRHGAALIVLSDRLAGTGSEGWPQRPAGASSLARPAGLAPIPSLLLTGAVHHHLIATRERARTGLIVEAADVRECHHVALLIGYGAAAVCPYLAIETVRQLASSGELGEVKPRQAAANLVTALGKGLLKIMSKMGVSTVASYAGAQVFEATGIGDEVIAACFAGTASPLGGTGFAGLAAEAAARHAAAFPAHGSGPAHRRLATGGEYQWRREGEPHLFSPEAVFRLQHSTRAGRRDIFAEYTRLVDDQSAALMTLRGLLRIRGIDDEAGAAGGGPAKRAAVPLAEVEPAASIVRRFSTGAMSYGSLSAEAHETLAIAMNRLGARSNTGEGGEDPARFRPDDSGDRRRSAVKQVASGRFGVTSEYLVNADDLQIKMAQGAKPGEGGQLPGAKVYPWIAATRYSTPGVGLISPPPHHDIYSIEDLAQLIHDLKNANPAARVHVKLVAEAGVGTVAAGVAKAHADVVLISGHDGGTGAAPLTSIKHAGTPWELGLAETQQTLLRGGLRDRVVLQVDGQLKTGRDVLVAALLGAEEFGFATAPLVVSGCVLMRVCHLDTCPVGVATQNPALRGRFTGRPEFVVNFFEFLAEQVREYLAALGFRTLAEAVGHAELLAAPAPASTAAPGTGAPGTAAPGTGASALDLTPLLHVPDLPPGSPRRNTGQQDHALAAALDNTLIQLAEGALADARPVTLELPVRNVNRTVGTMLGYEVTRRWGAGGLPDGTIEIRLRGSAGQSLGAFLPRGITLRLTGDANDYLGKGLSGGRIVATPDPAAPFAAEHQVIAGNVIGYGATAGEIFLRGQTGERFCVRNSGATAVAEGTGDHGCEYMTGGRVAILGPVGRNFAAGMSGGIAYLLDADHGRLNDSMVSLEALTEDDARFLERLISRHLTETGSPVARRLLADWAAALRRFSRVMPRDYARVLAATRQARLEGRDVDEAVMAAGHG
ncbi:MAG TPA: glutamate synthase large subunit [Streptosporangiaceae bacterium]